MRYSTIDSERLKTNTFQCINKHGTFYSKTNYHLSFIVKNGKSVLIYTRFIVKQLKASYHFYTP